MGDLFKIKRKTAPGNEEEIRLRAAYFEAIVACLRVAKGQDGVDRAVRKSLHAAVQSFRAYLAWQRQHEAVKNPIRYTIKQTSIFGKTLYGMISGQEESWAYVLAEADRIPGDRVLKELKRLSPFDGSDVIIVRGEEIEGDVASFFAHLRNGMRIWKKRLGEDADDPLFIALKH